MALHGAFDHEQPGAVDGMVVAVEVVRPDGVKVLVLMDSDAQD